jgi:hypothetical protein
MNLVQLRNERDKQKWKTRKKKKREKEDTTMQEDRKFV